MNMLLVIWSIVGFCVISKLSHRGYISLNTGLWEFLGCMILDGPIIIFATFLTAINRLDHTLVD